MLDSSGSEGAMPASDRDKPVDPAPSDDDGRVDPSAPAASDDERKTPPRGIAVPREVVPGGHAEDHDEAIELSDAADEDDDEKGTAEEAEETAAPMMEGEPLPGTADEPDGVPVVVESQAEDAVAAPSGSAAPARSAPPATPPMPPSPFGRPAVSAPPAPPSPFAKSAVAPAPPDRKTPAPAVRPSQPPGAAFRAAPIPGIVIPVPPPFVPFPEAAAVRQSFTSFPGVAHRPAVSPPPPPPPPAPPVASPSEPPVELIPEPEPVELIPEPEPVELIPEPEPVEEITPVDVAPPVVAPTPAVRRSTPPMPRDDTALPRVIISDEAYRPSRPPPQPVVAAVPAVEPPRPAPSRTTPLPAPTPVEEPAPVEIEAAAVQEESEAAGDVEAAAVAMAEEVPPPSAFEESAALAFDAVPSIISIPEDDVPRTMAAPPPPREPEKVEEIGDDDVQAVEPVEAEPAPATEAPAAEAPAAEASSARPPAQGATARRRKRRRVRRSWWEEIFDEEYLRSLPKYTAEYTRHEVDLIQRALGVEKGATILDLACGHGRHAVEFAARGYEVVGVDLSLPMLARAGEAAQERGVKINFIQGDMRELQFDAAFDAAYCVGTSFGYFDDDANARVIRGACQALKTRGLLLIETCNRDYIVREQPRSTWFQGEDRQYLEETDFNYITSRLSVKRSWAVPGGEQESVDFSIRLYSLHEIGMMLHSNGFKVTEATGNYATPGVFFGSDSAKLIILAEKR